MDVEAVWAEAERLWWAQDHDGAEPLLRRVAGTGHANAASLLGSLYAGRGLKEEAIRWNQVAAGQGWYTAMNNLALLLEDEDREEAVRWLRKAVTVPGDRTAEYNLGLFLAEDGLDEEAEHWFRVAAAVPFPGPRNTLANLLKEDGRVAEAEAWYRRAIDDGGDFLDDEEDEDYEIYTLIMLNLADLLEESGHAEEALTFRHRAASRGDTGSA
ncbi:tetratricopeptide repeat protein [Actinomadura scrupuli]|uniref:tetratricopeptide repeat protein n=1 Tax=Actinomadura scrupuli TaxID=559629 RepID=UPI003D9A02B0